MKKIFVYECGIFNSQLLIVVGKKAKDIKEWAKKSPKLFKECLDNKEIYGKLEEAINTNPGFLFTFYDSKKTNYYILYLEDFEDTWKWLDILNHEIVHYRQYQFSERKIEDEKEFEAYFQENVFREVRKLLWKKIKK